MKRQIHTTINSSTYNTLLELGNGMLNNGIEKAVESALSKRIIVRIITDIDINEHYK